MTTMRLTFEERAKRALTPGPGLVTAILAGLMVMCVIHNIVTVRWTDGMEQMRSAAFAGAIVGAIVANWRSLSGWLAHLLMLILGFGWSMVLFNPLLDQRLDSTLDKLTDLLIRAVVMIRAFKSGGSTEDFILFVLGVSLAAWFFAYLTMWLLFRSGWPWAAVLLNGAALMVNLTFASTKPRTSFWLFLVFGLLLIVFENFRARQRRWQIAALEQMDFLSLRFLWSGLVVCSLLVVGTGALPTNITSAKLEQLVDAVTSPLDGIKTPFGRSNVPAATAPQQATFTRTGVPLGGARTATNRVVMEVEASQADYWRSNALDFYNGTGWENTTGAVARNTTGAANENAALTSMAVGSKLIQIDTANRVPVTQTFRLRQDRGDQQLPAATTPLSWTLPVLVQHTYIPSAAEDELIPNFTDSSIYFAQEPVRAGLTYTVVSLVSDSDKLSLRQSSTVYPPWTRRYLQLPEGQSMRNIAGLARQIVAASGATTNFDKAVAIEQYLRTFPYDDQIQAPPSGVDPVEYFLFELKRGYCDYFASSMVLMLRSQGIPARWVQGYATGDFDPARNAFVVRDTFAHSWPEVYFTGYGWQRFEPTPGGYVTAPSRPEAPPEFVNGENPDDIGPNGGRVNQPAPLTSAELEAFKDQLAEDQVKPAPTPVATPPLETAPVPEAEASPVFRFLAWLMLLLGIAAAGLWWIRRREIRGLRPAAAFYAGVGQLARWAGFAQHAEQTPEEYAQTLGKALPPQRAAIKRVADAYTAERYGKSARVNLGDLREDAEAVSRPLARRAARRAGKLLMEQLAAQRNRLRRKP
ncbi:MAG TPA: transglutaminaseTgpA domain-containing protein [Herpetosiphonaceae bacterium]